MDQTIEVDSLGARMVWAARMAVAMHLEMENSQKLDQPSIGGTGPVSETMIDE